MSATFPMETRIDQRLKVVIEHYCRDHSIVCPEGGLPRLTNIAAIFDFTRGVRVWAANSALYGIVEDVIRSCSILVSARASGKRVTFVDLPGMPLEADENSEIVEPVTAHVGAPQEPSTKRRAASKARRREKPRKQTGRDDKHHLTFIMSFLFAFERPLSKYGQRGMSTVHAGIMQRLRITDTAVTSNDRRFYKQTAHRLILDGILRSAGGEQGPIRGTFTIHSAADVEIAPGAGFRVTKQRIMIDSLPADGIVFNAFIEHISAKHAILGDKLESGLVPLPASVEEAPHIRSWVRLMLLFLSVFTEDEVAAKTRVSVPTLCERFVQKREFAGSQLLQTNSHRAFPMRITRAKRRRKYDEEEEGEYVSEDPDDDEDEVILDSDSESGGRGGTSEEDEGALSMRLKEASAKRRRAQAEAQADE